MFYFIRPGTKPGSGYKQSAVTWRIVWTAIQTLMGIALMGTLLAGALMYFGLQWTWAALFLGLWVALPLAGWYYSADLVTRLTRATLPDPHNPDHARLIRIVNKLFPKTGLPVKPPVYVSPIKLPNALATGRDPRHSSMAVTEGLFEVDLTDDELEAILAHEFAHVKNWDVATNSLLASLGSLFSLILATGLPHIVRTQFSSSQAPLLHDLSHKVQDRKQRFFLAEGGVVGFVVMMALFYLVSYFTKFLSLFVVRVRESAADAQAAYWTGKPCALSTALQKLVLHVRTHAHDLRDGIVTRGVGPLLFVSPLEDPEEEALAEGTGVIKAIHRWWRNLGENHPPVEVRLAALDKMSGSSCPRIK